MTPRSLSTEMRAMEGFDAVYLSTWPTWSVHKINTVVRATLTEEGVEAPLRDFISPLDSSP